MQRRTPFTAATAAVLLAGCAASGALESSSEGPTTAASSPAADEDCIGRNAQDFYVPEPAASFGQAWNETDDAARLAFLEEALAEDATHVQREMDAALVSRDQMDAHIKAFQTNRPGEYFEWRGWQAWYMHHDRVFMPWRLCTADGGVLLEGFDFGIIGSDGRLVETTGFYPPE